MKQSDDQLNEGESEGKGKLRNKWGKRKERNRDVMENNTLVKLEGYQRRLKVSPAGHHENLMLERSGIREPSKVPSAPPRG